MFDHFVPFVSIFIHQFQRVRVCGFEDSKFGDHLGKLSSAFWSSGFPNCSDGMYQHDTDVMEPPCEPASLSHDSMVSNVTVVLRLGHRKGASLQHVA